MEQPAALLLTLQLAQPGERAFAAAAGLELQLRRPPWCPRRQQRAARPFIRKPRRPTQLFLQRPRKQNVLCKFPQFHIPILPRAATRDEPPSGYLTEPRP